MVSIMDSIMQWMNDQWLASESFSFMKSTPIMAHHITPMVTCIIYIMVLALLKKFIAWRQKPYDLNWLVVIHNGVLSIASCILLLISLVELHRMVSASSLFDVYCDPHIKFNAGRIYLFYHINYLFKFWELFDTVLLVLRGKTTPFLHVYHHASTLVLCWSQMRAESCMQWIPMIINLTVHVIMYAYFAMHALGIKCWWKKYLTRLQILQFMVGLSLCAIGLTMRILGEIVGIPGIPLCHGCYEGAFFGLGVLASYLYLFRIFYANTYRHTSLKANGSTRLHGAATATAGGAEAAMTKKNDDIPTANVSSKDD